MPARRTPTATAKPAEPAPGDAVLLPDGGEAILLRQNGPQALMRVGTAHVWPYSAPLDGLTAVEKADETERHARLRADAVRRGEIGA